jgi:phospholipase/carboxylesterase
MPTNRCIITTAPTPASHTLLLPGTGGDEHDLPALAACLGPAFNLLSLRGNVLENGMPRFFRRLGMGLFDEQDVIFRAHELTHFVRTLEEQEGFDPTQLVAVGYSNGANMAGALLMLYPDWLAGAVLWRPSQSLVHQQPTFTTSRQQPVHFSPGSQDPTFSLTAGARYLALLRKAGFKVSRKEVHAGHYLTNQDVETAAAWLRQHFLQRVVVLRGRS